MQKLINNDCLNTLSEMHPNTVDALITDPPAGISFMNKDWDDFGSLDNFQNEMKEIFTECLKVMKPGAHGLIWALPRTSHHTAMALERAGFEIRDVVTHLFGTGFPKSMNLGEGRGTALKPASEHWILIRKPIEEKTVAKNVLKYGTGGINIDACRIGFEQKDREEYEKKQKSFSQSENNGWKNTSPLLKTEEYLKNSSQGRFPANLVLDEVAAEMLDEQSGVLKSGGISHGQICQPRQAKSKGAEKQRILDFRPSSEGGASRFFYVAKASKSDKGEDNTHPTVKSTKLMEYLIKLITPENGVVLDPFMGSGSTGVACKNLGFDFIGIEREAEYFNIAKKRVA